MLVNKINNRIRMAILLSVTISIFVGVAFLILTKKPRIKAVQYGVLESDCVFWNGKIGFKKVDWKSTDSSDFDMSFGFFNYYSYRITLDESKNIKVIVYDKEKKIVNFKEYK